MNNPFGRVGLNLRLEFIDEVLDQKPKIPYFEIIVDNWFSTGPHHKKLLELRKNYDLLFHCVGMNLGGFDPLNLSYIKKIKELVQIYQPRHISDHICFQTHNNHSIHDLLPIPMNSSYVEHISKRVQSIQENLKDTILIENLSYYVEFEQSDLTEVEFTNQILTKSGANLLLDLNNIWVNQLNLGHSTTYYLENINFSKVREIHLAGPEKAGEVYVDTHGSFVSEEVLKSFKDTFPKTQSVPVIYERDTNIPPFQELLEERNKIENYLL